MLLAPISNSYYMEVEGEQTQPGYELNDSTKIQMIQPIFFICGN